VKTRHLYVTGALALALTDWSIQGTGSDGPPWTCPGRQRMCCAVGPTAGNWQSTTRSGLPDSHEPSDRAERSPRRFPQLPAAADLSCDHVDLTRADCRAADHLYGKHVLADSPVAAVAPSTFAPLTVGALPDRSPVGSLIADGTGCQFRQRLDIKDFRCRRSGKQGHRNNRCRGCRTDRQSRFGQRVHKQGFRAHGGLSERGGIRTSLPAGAKPLLPTAHSASLQPVGSR
jgi:hypothetical protein